MCVESTESVRKACSIGSAFAQRMPGQPQLPQGNGEAVEIDARVKAKGYRM